jgi:hypothetical protein
VSVVKARVRVLPHRLDKQVEGIAGWGGHMTLVRTIVIKAVCVSSLLSA